MSGEESGVQEGHSVPPHTQCPDPPCDQTIKDEPEDEFSIPLPLSRPMSCKVEPKEESQRWEGQDLEEGVVKVQKVEGLAGNRMVFRQGKQVVFRDEDGSGEDEDIMVDSGTFIYLFILFLLWHIMLSSYQFSLFVFFFLSTFSLCQGAEPYWRVFRTVCKIIHQLT